MAETYQGRTVLRSVGYAALIERYGLEVIPNWHKSMVAAGGVNRSESRGLVVEEVFPPNYGPGDTLGDQLEFALKYDGVNLAILAVLFRNIPEEDLLAYVRSKSTGIYARRVWFLYEFLTGATLPLDDLKQGNYVDLLDPDRYYTVTPAKRVRRQRINNNLLGDARFCPTIRRTDVLRKFEAADLPGRCRKVLSEYPPELLRRALGYLYAKETKSTFEIEHVTPDATRTERFVALLELAEREDFCEKTKLIDLQNRIVDPRFIEADYRINQNYVGETAARGKEIIHFVGPKPEDLPDLMDGLIAGHKRMEKAGVSAPVHATVVAHGFVFLHPFEDGNGRIHRFLIHNILSRRGFTPEGMMFPVSAAMLKNAADYDTSLEAFSRPLMARVKYSLDELGRLTVLNDTANWYKYIDLTPQAEALFRFIERTIETELVEELDYLAKYDLAKKEIRKIVDMPDRLVDLFIRFCLQNNGRLSAGKRGKYFDFLSDGEIGRMERVVRGVFGNEKPGGV